MLASILPLDALVAPISPEAPSGVDLRTVGDDIDEVIKAGRADKDVSEGAWTTKEGRRLADFGKVFKLSVELLSTKSKDLVVAVRLIEALIVRHGMAGLREGLWVTRELIERYWDTLYPSLDDGDVEYRAQPFVWLNDNVAWRLDEIPIPEEYHPLAELEAAFATVVQCRDEFLALYKLIEGKYGRDTPRVAGIHDRLEKHREALGDIVERKRAAEAPPETDVPVAEGQTAPSPRRKPGATEEPIDRGDALRRLLLIGTYVRKENPQSPLGYRIVRAAQWADVGGGDPIAQAELVAPPTELRTRLLTLEKEATWADFLEATEEAVASPAGRYWLDLQRHVVNALEHLGTPYAPCVEAVKDELRRYVARFPELPQLTLQDYTAAATPETQTWIATAIVVPESAPAPVGVTNGTEAAPDTWREAQVRAKAGQRVEALELLREQILRAPCGREAFLWKLRLAELCIGERMSKLAVPLLEELAEQIDRCHLEEWEPRELSARVFSALYHCCEQEKNGSGVYETRAQQSFARLCRLDVSRAFRDGNA